MRNKPLTTECPDCEDGITLARNPLDRVGDDPLEVKCERCNGTSRIIQLCRSCDEPIAECVGKALCERSFSNNLYLVAGALLQGQKEAAK